MVRRGANEEFINALVAIAQATQTDGGGALLPATGFADS
jgi:hypothetical protein